MRMRGCPGAELLISARHLYPVTKVGRRRTAARRILMELRMKALVVTTFVVSFAAFIWTTPETLVSAASFWTALLMASKSR